MKQKEGAGRRQRLMGKTQVIKRSGSNEWRELRGSAYVLYHGTTALKEEND